ncbi:MAG TPA: hypothetical protein HPP83_04765 [Candidatus Hydrogenedentes bacterium]|nr:hypothetical protein [Candidatus Hydrogenedentota bacterium]
MSHSERILPPAWLLWPFRALWALAGLIAKAVGALLAMLLGLGFMALGLLFTSTIIGAVIGIPLFVLGFLLLVKGLF